MLNGGESLSSDQQSHFDTEGYLVLDRFLSADHCAALRAEVDDLMQRRAAGEDPLIVAYAQMGQLTSHPAAMQPVEQLMASKFAMHHIHATRHGAGERGVSWHQDYEQLPQTNRSHLMVHIFFYLNGLNGEIGDLLLVPRSQHQVVAGNGLQIFATRDLPGCVCVNELAPGSAVVVHSALFHARRPKPGGQGRPRYFIDVSYCQRGVRWPAYRRLPEVNAAALAAGLDRDGRYKFLYDTAQFYDTTPYRERLAAAAGSLVLGSIGAGDQLS